MNGKGEQLSMRVELKGKWKGIMQVRRQMLGRAGSQTGNHVESQDRCALDR